MALAPGQEAKKRSSYVRFGLPDPESYDSWTFRLSKTAFVRDQLACFVSKSGSFFTLHRSVYCIVNFFRGLHCVVIVIYATEDFPLPDAVRREMLTASDPSS